MSLIRVSASQENCGSKKFCSRPVCDRPLNRPFAMERKHSSNSKIDRLADGDSHDHVPRPSHRTSKKESVLSDVPTVAHSFEDLLSSSQRDKSSSRTSIPIESAGLSKSGNSKSNRALSESSIRSPSKDTDSCAKLSSSKNKHSHVSTCFALQHDDSKDQPVSSYSPSMSSPTGDAHMKSSKRDLRSEDPSSTTEIESIASLSSQIGNSAQDTNGSKPMHLREGGVDGQSATLRTRGSRNGYKSPHKAESYSSQGTTSKGFAGSSGEVLDSSLFRCGDNGSDVTNGQILLSNKGKTMNTLRSGRLPNGSDMDPMITIVRASRPSESIILSGSAVDTELLDAELVREQSPSLDVASLNNSMMNSSSERSRSRPSSSSYRSNGREGSLVRGSVVEAASRSRRRRQKELAAKEDVETVSPKKDKSSSDLMNGSVPGVESVPHDPKYAFAASPLPSVRIHPTYSLGSNDYYTSCDEGESIGWESRPTTNKNGHLPGFHPPFMRIVSPLVPDTTAAGSGGNSYDRRTRQLPFPPKPFSLTSGTLGGIQHERDYTAASSETSSSPLNPPSRCESPVIPAATRLSRLNNRTKPEHAPGGEREPKLLTTPVDQTAQKPSRRQVPKNGPCPMHKWIVDTSMFNDRRNQPSAQFAQPPDVIPSYTKERFHRGFTELYFTLTGVDVAEPVRRLFFSDAITPVALVAILCYVERLVRWHGNKEPSTRPAEIGSTENKTSRTPDHDSRCDTDLDCTNGHLNATANTAKNDTASMRSSRSDSRSSSDMDNLSATGPMPCGGGRGTAPPTPVQGGAPGKCGPQKACNGPEEFGSLEDDGYNGSGSHFSAENSLSPCRRCSDSSDSSSVMITGNQSMDAERLCCSEECLKLGEAPSLNIFSALASIACKMYDDTIYRPQFFARTVLRLNAPAGYNPNLPIPKQFSSKNEKNRQDGKKHTNVGVTTDVLQRRAARQRQATARDPCDANNLVSPQPVYDAAGESYFWSVRALSKCEWTVFAALKFDVLVLPEEYARWWNRTLIQGKHEEDDM